jgi:acyl-CoA thioester hydrolase
MKWDYPNPFIMDITVAEADTDRLGHTNNQVYLKWFEDVSWQHVEPNGMPWALQEELGKAMAITRTEIDYIAASYVGEQLQLATWIISSDGRLLSSRAFQIVRPSDNKVLARAQSHYACIDLKTGRPSRMPNAISDTLGKLCIKDM